MIIRYTPKPVSRASCFIDGQIYQRIDSDGRLEQAIYMAVRDKDNDRCLVRLSDGCLFYNKHQSDYFNATSSFEIVPMTEEEDEGMEE